MPKSPTDNPSEGESRRVTPWTRTSEKLVSHSTVFAVDSKWFRAFAIKRHTLAHVESECFASYLTTEP